MLKNANELMIQIDSMGNEKYCSTKMHKTTTKSHWCHRILGSDRESRKECTRLRIPSLRMTQQTQPDIARLPNLPNLPHPNFAREPHVPKSFASFMLGLLGTVGHVDRLGESASSDGVEVGRAAGLPSGFPHRLRALCASLWFLYKPQRLSGFNQISFR